MKKLQKWMGVAKLKSPRGEIFSHLLSKSPAKMAASEPQNVEDITATRGLDEDAKGVIEPVTADWRVEAAVKTRWHSIRTNPKIIVIALFAS